MASNDCTDASSCIRHETRSCSQTWRPVHNHHDSSEYFSLSSAFETFSLHLCMKRSRTILHNRRGMSANIQLCHTCTRACIRKGIRKRMCMRETSTACADGAVGLERYSAAAERLNLRLDRHQNMGWVCVASGACWEDPIP